MSFISSYGAPVFFLATRSTDNSSFRANLIGDATYKWFDVILEHSVKPCYDTNTQCFTAPVNGLYYIKAHLAIINQSTNSDDSIRWGFKIVRNSGMYHYRLTADNFEGTTTSTREQCYTLSTTITMNVGDKIYLYGADDVGVLQTLYANKSYFMGQLISPMTTVANPALPFAEYASKITVYAPAAITQSGNTTAGSLYTSTTSIYTTTTGILVTPSTPAYAPYTHTLGANTNRVFAILIGGGGGGGGGGYQNGGSNGGGGGSGGSAAAKFGYFSVTGGSTLTINVGYGGLGGSSTNASGSTNGYSTAYFTQYDYTSVAVIVGGSGQVGGTSSIYMNSNKILDAPGGSGSLSNCANSGAPVYNTSIYAIAYGTNSSGGAGGTGGQVSAANSSPYCIFDGGYNGNNGNGGAYSSNSGGTVSGGAAVYNQFGNFGVNGSGRNFFPPPTDSGHFATNVGVYDLYSYNGIGGAGGKGEGSSTNSATQGISGTNGVVCIFEYSV